ncbi:hypothetical protein J4210_06595 [Candidatus Woesearchaeota archaeon]|nr:hypothetical protein [Candidatus Woesearchaeota archaeon]
MIERYDDLPLDELMVINNPAAYGWGTVFRNTAAYERDRVLIPFQPNPEDRWDCGYGATKVHQKLAALGIESRVVYGVDRDSIFANHLWVELSDGRQLDPTPLYPFTNTRHIKRGVVDTTQKPTYFFIPSGLSAICSYRTTLNGETYLSEFGFEILREVGWITIGISHQIKKVSNTSGRFSVTQKILSYPRTNVKTFLNPCASFPADDFLSATERFGLVKTESSTGSYLIKATGRSLQLDPRPQLAEFEFLLEEEAGLFSAFAQNVLCAQFVEEERAQQQEKSADLLFQSLKYPNMKIIDYIGKDR